MAEKNQDGYEAKLTDVLGVARARVPMAVVHHLGGKVGDYMIFRISKSGVVTVTLQATAATKKNAPVAGKKKAAGKKKK
jgi:hypothetical protein